MQLAFVGDAVYELHARTLFLWPLTTVRAQRTAAVELVRAETQSLHLRRLLAPITSSMYPASSTSDIYTIVDADAAAVAVADAAVGDLAGDADVEADAEAGLNTATATAAAVAASTFVPTPAECTLLRRGRNASGPGPGRLLDRSAYGEASALETLLGHLYLSNDPQRLQALLDALLALAALPPSDVDSKPVDWKALSAVGDDEAPDNDEGI